MVISVTGNEHSWLPFDRLACSGCPYFANGKCSGEVDATPQSFTLDDDSVVGCLTPQKQIKHFSNLQSLKVPKGVARHDFLQLPQIIFGINDGFKDFPPFSDDDFFAISFRNLVDGNGFFKYRTPKKLREALKLSPNSKLALSCVALDPILENFWAKTSRTESWQRLAEFGFEFITSLSLSVYDAHPRFDQIYNRERNLLSHDALLENGVNSIPFLFFYNDKDFFAIVAWLKDRPDITHIAVHAQQITAMSGVQKLLAGMERLQIEVVRPLHFVVVGVFSVVKCTPLKAMFPRLTIITSSPLYRAVCGKRLLPDLLDVDEPIEILNSTLAVPNMRTFEEFYSKA